MSQSNAVNISLQRVGWVTGEAVAGGLCCLAESRPGGPKEVHWLPCCLTPESCVNGKSSLTIHNLQNEQNKNKGNLYNRFLQKNTKLRLIFPLLVLPSYLHVKYRLVHKPTCVPDIQTQLPWNQWQSSCLQWRLLGFAHIYRIWLSWKLKGITAFQKLERREKEMRRQICCERDPRWNNWSKFSCLDVVSFSIITIASSCFHWGEVTWDFSSSNGNFNTQMTRTVKVALHLRVSTCRIKV